MYAQHYCSCWFEATGGCQSWRTRVKFLPFCLFMCLLTYLHVILANILAIGLVQTNAVALYLYYENTASKKAHKQEKLSKFDPGGQCLQAFFQKTPKNSLKRCHILLGIFYKKLCLLRATLKYETQNVQRDLFWPCLAPPLGVRWGLNIYIFFNWKYFPHPDLGL